MPVMIPSVEPGMLNLLESVEAAHADLAFNQQVSTLLGITRPPTQMDSQAKYACLARGDGGVYLRMPINAMYQEKIWVSHTDLSLLHCRNHYLCFRTMLPARCSFMRPVELSRTPWDNHLILASGEPLEKTGVL